MLSAQNPLPADADDDDDGILLAPAKEAVGIVADPCGQTEAWDDDFEPAEAVETGHPSAKLKLLRSSSIGAGGGVVGVGAYPRNKTPDIGGGGVLGVESPWLGSGGNMFVRNVTPDLGFARNITPDIGGGNMFGGSGVMSSSRKLQDVLAALSSIRSDDANAPTSLAPAAIGSDDLPVQGAGWTPVEEDALDEQELKVAFARSRKVADMQSEALLSLAVSLAMCSRFTDADAAFQQALAVLNSEQLQPQTLNLRCRILLEQGIMFLAASKISSQSSKVSRAKDCLSEAINLMQSIPTQLPSNDLSAASASGDGAAAVSVACAHIVLAQVFKDSGDALNASKHLIAHLHLLISPIGSHPPLLPPSTQRVATLVPPSPTLFLHASPSRVMTSLGRSLIAEKRFDTAMSVLSKAVSLTEFEGLSAAGSRALLQVAIKEMQKEAAKKSASDCSESDAVEDWDAEIEADNSASNRIHGTAGKFQFGRLNNADGETEESVLPLRHQVLKQLTKSTVTRVTKFPKPSIMWSMRLPDGRRSMSEGAFLNWIKDYVAARADSSATLRTRDGSEAEQKLPYASHGFQVSSEWALEYLVKTYSMYRLGNIDESWRALQSFFIILLTSAKQHDELDAEEAFDRAAIFRCAYHLLRYGGKMWLPSRSSEFKGFLASCRAYALGVNTIVLDILEQQVLGHHAHLSPTDIASIPSQLAGQFLSVCTLIPDMIPVFLSVNSDVRDGVTLADSASSVGVGGGTGEDKKGKGHTRQKSIEQFPPGLGITVSSSRQSKRKPSHDGASPMQNAPVFFALQPIEITAEALTAIVLLETGHSPLSCDVLPEGRVFQLTNINLPPKKNHAQAEEQHLALEGLSEKLRSSEYRVLLLLKISTFLSATSMVRARALYACSLFYFSRAARNRQQQGGTSAPLRLSDKNDAILCEQVLFEALYIAYSATAPFSGCVPSVSSFAEAALLKFGDVLLFLGKYTFAIVAYESCVMAHQLRTSRDHHELNRRLAGICLQHGDEPRALSFYQKVLARAREGLNSDEIYFLSEKTADLYMDQGEFTLAEEQLASVIATCEMSVSSGTGGHLKVDNTFLRLQLKHCAIQLLSSDPARAAGVVETLVCCALPHGKRGQVLQFLADIYLKNSWQRECFGVLRLTLRDHPAIKLSAPTIMSVAMGKQKVEGINSSLYESAARCCLKGGLLLEGLEWINRALMCKDARDGTLVRAYRLLIRGKILSQLSSPTQLVIFPTQLKCSRGSWSAAVKESRDGSYAETADHELFCSVAEIEAAVVAAGGDHPSVPETMNCSGAASIIHYALESLKSAYEIYQPLGDTLKMTKCLIAVAELRLDSIFSVCALSGMSLHQALLDNMVVQPESGRAMSAQERLNVRNEYLRSIDEPSRLGLDLAVSLWDVGLVLRGLLCMAESRYLHSDVNQARLYWSEAKDLFFYCFIGSSGEILIADAPTPYLKKMMRIFTRCLRFLMCCEPEYIHRHRVMMDVHIRFEHVIRRSEHIFSGNASESFSSLASLDVVPEDGVSGPTSIFAKQKTPSWGKSSFGSGSGRSRGGSKLFTTTFPPNQQLRASGAASSLSTNSRMQTFSMNLIWKSLHCCRVVCDKMKRGAVTADEARASNLLTLQAMIKGLQHTRVPNFPKLLFRGKGSSEGPEPEVLYALQFDDVIAFVPPPPLRPITHIFGGRRGYVFSVLHNSSSSLNVNLHGLTVAPGGREISDQRQQQENQQKILRDAGGGIDVSAFSDDFQQYFQATFMSADVLRLITHWFATSSDQLEDKATFEKEARSVISLMQLPLTGVFNRLTLSVCRATIDTQSLSRVSAFEWDSSALQQRLSAPSKPLPPVVLVCSRVLQAIPWELMSPNRPICRALSHMHCVNALEAMRLRQQASGAPSSHAGARSSSGACDGGGLQPMFFMVFSSATTDVSELQRKSLVNADILRCLHHTNSQTIPVRSHRSSKAFHSPLAKLSRRISATRRKYHRVTFVDTDEAGWVSSIVNSLKPHQHPIVILTLADIVSLTQPCMDLSQARPECTFLFVPPPYFKVVYKSIVELLGQRQKELLNGTIKLYDVLLTTVTILRTSMRCPIIFMNAPVTNVAVLSTRDSGDVALLDAATAGIGTSSTTQHTDSVSEGGGESAGAASTDDQVGMS